MPPIINAQGISKAFGANPLFQNVSFTVTEGDRIGLIGPNGSGKSTLLRILAGEETPDDGEVAFRKRLRVSHVLQDSQFPSKATVRSVAEHAMERVKVHQTEQRYPLCGNTWSRGFENLEAEAVALSGGWRKRLAIVEALVQAPDLLLLDEPTNHLDLAGIEWLEALLEEATFACVIVSHDRYFLENVATDMAELSRVYPDGVLRVRGNYSTFLEKKEEFLHAQSKRQEALENRVHTEIEWLRRGAKARTRKSKARIDKANELIGDLADLNARTRTASAQIDFSGDRSQDQAADRTGRRDLPNSGASQPKHSFRQAELRYHRRDARRPRRPERKRQNHAAAIASRRVVRRRMARSSRADGLRIVYFDQNRELDSERHPAPRPGSRQRFGHLSGSRDSRGLLGGPIPVHRRTAESTGRAAFRRRTRARADCATHAATRRRPAARRADQRSRYSDTRNSRRKPARISRRSGAGDARSLHARSRFHHRAWA